MEVPEFRVIKGYSPKGENWTLPPDKYSVDYFKGGECVLGHVNVASIQLAKTNGDMPLPSTDEDGYYVKRRRANAMRVYKLDKRGLRGEEYGLYKSNGKGGWVKVSVPGTPSYAAEVKRVLEGS